MNDDIQKFNVYKLKHIGGCPEAMRMVKEKFGTEETDLRYRKKDFHSLIHEGYEKWVLTFALRLTPEDSIQNVCGIVERQAVVEMIELLKIRVGGIAEEMQEYFNEKGLYPADTILSSVYEFLVGTLLTVAEGKRLILADDKILLEGFVKIVEQYANTEGTDKATCIKRTVHLTENLSAFLRHYSDIRKPLTNRMAIDILDLNIDFAESVN